MSKHDHAYDEDTGAAYGTYKTYIIGFFLSVLLTLIAFYCVGYQVLPAYKLYWLVAGLALIQLIVQLVFFLHLSTHSKARWNLVSFVFALIVVIILVSGTLWIMYNLYALMMPDM